MKQARGLTILASAALLFGFAASPAHAARHNDQGKAKQESLYPDSTRKEPKLDLTSQKDSEAINKALDAVNEGDRATAEPLLQKVIDSSKSKYAQALALQGLASLKYNDGDTKGAVENLQSALALGVMPNDTYFQLSYMLAQFQIADEQYQPALDTIAKWRAEGKKETPESYALEGNAYYRLEKYPEAIEALNKAKSLAGKSEPSWDQMLMASYAESGQSDKAAELAEGQLDANPDDPNALNNAVAVLMQAQKYPEAIQLMEKARAAGTLTKDSHYINLAKLYLMSAQDGDDPVPAATKAGQVLDDGIAKKVITPNAEVYTLQGQAAEMANQSDKAISHYQQAQAVATDGEPALRAAYLLLTESKFSQAKTQVNQAIAKGVKRTGAAYMLLGQIEVSLKNKPAAIAAVKKAAQDPDTAEKAKAWLKQAGAG